MLSATSIECLSYLPLISTNFKLEPLHENLTITIILISTMVKVRIYVNNLFLALSEVMRGFLRTGDFVYPLQSKVTTVGRDGSDIVAQVKFVLNLECASDRFETSKLMK